ncbi:hypothetical protein C8P67_11825 [Flavobacterium aquicola]|uniref:Uncharacterized protein n=1 Tax=Flavobacterium aquicola TaxID=1682742 RepID=A0A3E0DZD3_9FLAO|nr:hypothetical protein C8P67_11825 [Flavobacterium aquicola]
MISFCAIALLSSGVLYYSIGMENESETEPVSKSKKIKRVLTENEREKNMILQELKDLKKTYDEIILENKTMSFELIQERDKVIKLMTDLVASKGDQIAIDKYRDQVKSLQEKLAMVTVENVELKEQNVSIKRQNANIKEQRDITEVVLNESQKKNEGLKRDLQNTVEKFSKLEVSGTSIVTYRLKSSGDLIVTDKANKVGGINISFVIAKNEIAKPIDKTYYIQVMNSENLILGDDDMRTHQYKSLTYSMASNVRYENKMVRVSENIMGKNFAKGTYYVNIYDGENLVDESSFVLK